MIIRLLLLLVFTISASAKPNIVFIIADDCTFRDLGCYGGQAHTPNINKLAGQGMSFTRCFQTAPMCSPTRHNIYTGIPPVVSGAYPNHTFVAPDTKSVVQYLSKLGYAVAQSGKTHVSPNKVFSWKKSLAAKTPNLKKWILSSKNKPKRRTPSASSFAPTNHTALGIKAIVPAILSTK